MGWIVEYPKLDAAAFVVPEGHDRWAYGLNGTAPYTIPINSMKIEKFFFPLWTICLNVRRKHIIILQTLNFDIPTLSFPFYRILQLSWMSTAWYFRCKTLSTVQDSGIEPPIILVLFPSDSHDNLSSPDAVDKPTVLAPLSRQAHRISLLIVSFPPYQWFQR